MESSTAKRAPLTLCILPQIPIHIQYVCPLCLSECDSNLNPVTPHCRRWVAVELHSTFDGSLVITPISSPPVPFHRASHSVCIRDVEVCDRGVAHTRVLSIWVLQHRGTMVLSSMKPCRQAKKIAQPPLTNDQESPLNAHLHEIPSAQERQALQRSAEDGHRPSGAAAGAGRLIEKKTALHDPTKWHTELQMLFKTQMPNLLSNRKTTDETSATRNMCDWKQ